MAKLSASSSMRRYEFLDNDEKMESNARKRVWRLETDYPQLGLSCYTGAVVLFTNFGDGEVVDLPTANAQSRYSIGHHSDTWAMHVFRPVRDRQVLYAGSQTIRELMARPVASPEG